MSEQVPISAGHGLERLCKPSTFDEAVPGNALAGLERMHMAMGGHEAFSPHRHDTLAVGITLRGVQTFIYRGERRASLPGDVHVLAPDELHDGAPGTEDGFEYRIVYFDPALLDEFLGPSVRSYNPDPVCRQPTLDADQRWLLWGTPVDADTVEQTDAIAALARLLRLRPTRTPRSLPVDQLRRVRDLLHAGSEEMRLGMDDLEHLTGLDRWSIARGFRQLYGTSPSRYRIMRRLDGAKQQILSGASLAQAAHMAGFADQSHFNRQFKAAFGMTPSWWQTVMGNQFARPNSGPRQSL